MFFLNFPELWFCIDSGEVIDRSIFGKYSMSLGRCCIVHFLEREHSLETKHLLSRFLLYWRLIKIRSAAFGIATIGRSGNFVRELLSPSCLPVLQQLLSLVILVLQVPLYFQVSLQGKHTWNSLLTNILQQIWVQLMVQQRVVLALLRWVL